MIRPVIMPKLGDTVEEAKIVTWLKGEGEWIDKGSAILVAETDKVSIEVEALASGYLRKRLYPEGQTVPVTLTIAYLADSLDEALPGSDSQAQRHEDARGIEGPPHPVNVPSGTFTPLPLKGGEGRFEKQGVSERVGLQATPVAKRLARERGIDLSEVKGTGPGGRITERDLLNFSEMLLPEAPRSEAERQVPLSAMRRRIAERMSASKATAPHFYITTRIDMSAAVSLRARLKLEGRSVPSYQAMVIKAVAEALKAHPELNASYSDGGVAFHAEVNIGVAVSLENGLVVPVVRNADRKGALAITAEVDQLAEKARGNRLLPADYEGGSFTVSNLGMYPVDQFIAIINPPQAAILALGRIGLEPVALGTESGNYLGFAHLMHATLSVDHRIVDGAGAARFIATFKELLEKPEGLSQ